MKPTIYIIVLILRFIVIAGLLFGATQKIAFSSDKITNRHDNMIAIDRNILRDTVQEGGYIGVISVISVKILRRGTRGERALVDINIEQKIFGEETKPVGISFYTSNGKSDLQEGKKYIVVLKDMSIFQPYQELVALQQLVCEDCTKIINAYKNAIENK